jgi:hypothetical protein
MTRRRVLLGLGALALAAAVWIVRWSPLPLDGAAPDDGFTRLGGVVHVHTTLSDGSGSPEATIAAAQHAGLDFLILTDHNNLDAKSYEGYHGRLLVLVGTEISTTAGHVVGIGVAAPHYRFSGDALDALEDIRDLGGVAFAAHPFSPRPDLRWTGWSLPGPWGLELINGDSQWREAGWGRLLWTTTLYGLNPRYALLTSLSPPTATLARWDRLLRDRFVAGIVGADAHARVPVTKNLAVPFPSYESLFALARNYVLLDKPLSGRSEEDGAAVVAALAQGRSYVGLSALAAAGGFYFEAQGPNRRYAMGDAAPAGTALRLKAGGRIPASARVRLLRDGVVVAEAPGGIDRACPGPGVYRVEVRLPGWSVPWILSNPLEVFSAAREAERRRRADWPTPAPAPSPAESLDESTFHAEFDSASSMDPAALVAAQGPGGGPALRLRFRLGKPGPRHPFVSCALVSRSPRDLTGRKGLVFSIKGDRTYRVWVQVRDLNPASTDDGTEWWFASVRPSPGWERMALPFDRLRSINPRTDGHLDLDKVRMIAFVLDAGAVPPGTEGSIWLADLGVY